MSFYNYSHDKQEPRVSIYQVFSEPVAMAIYRFILGIGNKGAITKLTSKKEYAVWSHINTDIKSCAYHSRLWKGLYAKEYHCCTWCKCPSKKNSEQYGCTRYVYSRKLVNKLFGIDPLEIDFIHRRLSVRDRSELQSEIFDEVEYIVTHKQENVYYKRITGNVITRLSNTGHFKSKMSKGRSMARNYGIDGEDITSHLYQHVCKICRIESYLPEYKLIKVCGKALNNELCNMFSKNKRKKRAFQYRPNNVADTVNDEGESTSYEEMYSNDYNVEGTVTSSILFNDTLKIVDNMPVRYNNACAILLGKEVPEFIGYLKKEGIVQSNKKWSNFYKESEPANLMTLVNDFTGVQIDRALRQAVTTKLGEKTMKNLKTETTETSINDKITISVPKKQCIICAYFVPWLGKKRVPKDCDTDFPGCPCHSIEFKYEFPIKQAAKQLLGYMNANNNEAINEFMSNAPNSGAILEEVAILRASGDYCAPEVEEIIDDEFTDMDLKELRAFYLESDDLDDIPDIKSMDEDTLRDAIRAALNGEETDLDDDDEDGDDEDDDGFDDMSTNDLRDYIMELGVKKNDAKRMDRDDIIDWIAENVDDEGELIPSDAASENKDFDDFEANLDDEDDDDSDDDDEDDDDDDDEDVTVVVGNISEA